MDRETRGVKCPECKLSWCPSCMQEAHGKKTCHEARNQLGIDQHSTSKQN